MINFCMVIISFIFSLSFFLSFCHAGSCIQTADQLENVTRLGACPEPSNPVDPRLFIIWSTCITELESEIEKQKKDLQKCFYGRETPMYFLCEPSIYRYGKQKIRRARATYIIVLFSVILCEYFNLNSSALSKYYHFMS